MLKKIIICFKSRTKTGKVNKMNNSDLKKVQLTNWHEKSGAKMVPFAGYYMPIQYTSIIKEHLAVRNDVGIFDVSHMGRMWFKGEDAEAFLDSIVPRDVTKASTDSAIYTFALSENATFKDDLVISKLSDDLFLLVWNAGNYDKLKSWIINILKIVKRFQPEIQVTLTDITRSSTLYALQGPRAHEVIKRKAHAIPGRWKIVESEIADIKVFISGTGYTGEKGYEIMVPNTTIQSNEKALKVWNAILEEDVILIGLGARDSLRLEAGFPLFGNDIDEETHPVEADLVFGPPFVHLDKSGYSFGMNKLKKLIEQDPKQLRTGLTSLKRQRPKIGMELYNGDRKVGEITSGAYSPILKKGIGMGYIDRTLAKQYGTILTAKKDRREIKVKITKMPFYDTKKYGYKRET